jgi:hypothetical protein
MKVGVTGHQQLGGEETTAWLSHTLETCIEQYRIEQGITSLAIGADQLYAEVLKRTNIPYLAVIPSADYVTTFTNNHDLARYQEFLRDAFEIIHLPFEQGSETAYYEAGKRVVDLSDLLLAIWNGLPARGLGGTADIVRYALSREKQVIHINPLTQKISVI